MVAPALRRRAAGHLVKTHGISERRASRVMQIRFVARYRSIARREDGPIEVRLRALALQYPRYGYLMLHHLMSAEGLVANRKRTYRIYTALGLQVRTKRRRKITRPRISIPVPDGPNQRWLVDFVSDQLSNGRRFRILNLVDDYSRECVGQITDFSISGERLARFLDEVAGRRSLPQTLVCDNGSELTSKAMFFWSRRARTRLHFIQPGKPTQNAFVESFNGSFRDTCLNQHWFKDLFDARRSIDIWRQHYIDVRPHSSLGYRPPSGYAKQAA